MFPIPDQWTPVTLRAQLLTDLDEAVDDCRPFLAYFEASTTRGDMCQSADPLTARRIAHANADERAEMADPVRDIRALRSLDLMAYCLGLACDRVAGMTCAPGRVCVALQGLAALEAGQMSDAFWFALRAGPADVGHWDDLDYREKRWRRHTARCALMGVTPSQYHEVPAPLGQGSMDSATDFFGRRSGWLPALPALPALAA